MREVLTKTTWGQTTGAQVMDRRVPATKAEDSGRAVVRAKEVDSAECWIGSSNPMDP